MNLLNCTAQTDYSVFIRYLMFGTYIVWVWCWFHVRVNVPLTEVLNPFHESFSERTTVFIKNSMVLPWFSITPTSNTLIIQEGNLSLPAGSAHNDAIYYAQHWHPRLPIHWVWLTEPPYIISLRILPLFLWRFRLTMLTVWTTARDWTRWCGYIWDMSL